MGLSRRKGAERGKGEMARWRYEVYLAEGGQLYVEREGERAEEIVAELEKGYVVMADADIPDTTVIFNADKVLFIEAREIRNGQKGKMR